MENFNELFSTVAGWNLMINFFQLLLMYWIASAVFNIRDDIQNKQE